MDACRRPSRQKIFDSLAVMDGRTIPDDQQFARNLAQQLLEKAHHILALVRVILRLHEQPSFRCQRADGRAVFGPLEHRCALPWAANKSPTHLQKRSVAAPARLFLRAGQRSSFQVLMACSFLWLANSTGFCWLWLMERKR